MQNNIFLTLFVGQNLVKLPEVNSTNTYLKDLLSNSKPLVEGTVIMADRQFAGRGQYENKWEAEAGKNLTISIYLNPYFLPVNKQFELNKVISLGINDCLTEIIGNECKIKWPNDVYFKDQKIGGVLIENNIKGYQLKDSIIGIGLNVNQKLFPIELENRVNSISKVLHQDYNLDILLKQLCSCIEKRYLQLKNGSIKNLSQQYIEQLYGLNEVRDFEIDGKKVSGVIKTIDESGKLCVYIDKEIKKFDLKEIKFLFD